MFSDKSMKTLGEKIKAARITKGLTQEDLAFQLDLTVGSFSRIERGLTDIRWSRIEHIAKALEMSTIDLILFGEESRKESEITTLRRQLEEQDKKMELKDQKIMMLQEKVIKLMEGKK